MIFLLLFFCSLCLGCSTSSSCGCGGRCEIQDAVCYIRGPDCKGSTPICISSTGTTGTCVQCNSDFDCPYYNPYCIENSCVRCRNTNDCATDNNCDSFCSGIIVKLILI